MSSPGYHGFQVVLSRLGAVLAAALLLACGGAHYHESQGSLVSPMQVTRVRVEGADSPTAVERTSPRITWNLLGTAQGDRSIAYQIQANDASGLSVWDSGKADQPHTLDATWAGRALPSRASISLRIRAWDQANRPTAWSTPTTFEVGLLSQSDWLGKWIAATDAQPDPTTPLPSPHLRRDFRLDKPVKRARAYVAGIGYHEAYVNGQRVGDQVLDPGFTRFDRRTLYVVHDVTNLLRPGANAVGIILGNGFFNPSWVDAWDFQSAPWRATPRLLLQLEIEHTDGSRSVVVTDETWRTKPGPILRDALRNGENYDARMELPGWANPGSLDVRRHQKLTPWRHEN